jgi:ABC-2 type transport system ATP-binding protein
MKRDGHTVLLTTHYLDEAEALCDCVAIIDHGRIVAAGSPHVLMARSTAVERITVITDPPIETAVLEAIPRVENVRVTENGAELHSASAVESVAALLGLVETRGARLVELHVQKASLEDVFIELTAAERT